MEFKAFITNLGAYNEGELKGEWISFPISEEELEKVYERIGIDELHEEIFFTDYDAGFVDMGLEEFESVDNLNKIAEALIDKTDSEVAIIKSVYDDYNCKDIDEAIRIVDDALIIYPANNCDSGSDEDLAYSYLETLCGGFNAEEVGEDNIRMYFDEEAFIRDYNIENPDEEIEDLDELGLSVDDLDKETIERYFDYDGYGRDLAMDFNWIPEAECWICTR